MDVKVVESLEKGIEAGAVGLPTKVLVPGGKPGKALLEQLKEKGYLKSDDGKKFDVTETGWDAWQTHVAPERREKVRAAALRKLLETIQAGGGKKKLRAKDLAACPERWRTEAVERKFYHEVKPETYQVLPAGEAFLESLLPLSVQLERRQQEYRADLEALQEASKKLAERVTALQERLLPECERLKREVGEAAAGIRQEVVRAVEEKHQAVREATETLRGAAAFALLGQQIRARAEELAASVLEKVESKVRELNGPVEDAAQLKNDMASLQSALSNHVLHTETELARLSREAAARPSEPSAAPTPTANGAVSDAELLEALRKAHREIDSANPALGGTVRIPELFDRLREQGKITDLATFHQHLLKWEKEDHLRLRVYDDPHAEPRRAEGIESGAGLLFYVRLK